MIAMRERSKNLPPVVSAIGENPRLDTPWLEIENEERRARVKNMPTLDTVPFELDVQLVIEFYS